MNKLGVVKILSILIAIAIGGIAGFAKADAPNGVGCDYQKCKPLEVTSKIKFPENLENSVYAVAWKLAGRQGGFYYEIYNNLKPFFVIDYNERDISAFGSYVGDGKYHYFPFVGYVIEKDYYDKSFKTASLYDYMSICSYDFYPDPNKNKELSKKVCDESNPGDDDFLFDDGGNKQILINEFKKNLIKFYSPDDDLAPTVEWYKTEWYVRGSTEIGGYEKVEGYVPIINPLKSIEVYYEADKEIKDGKLALYKTKEIHYFDDGSKKELDFNVPQPGISNNTTGQVQENAAPVKISFLQKILNFFKALLGI